MATKSNYNTPLKRRKEKKTDYKQRLELLKSGKPRAVIRTSNQHTRVHITRYKKEGDINKAQTISKKLKEYGWSHNTGNIPAAYLTGYLAGQKTNEKEAILDIGLRKPRKGGRIFAALKGMRDAGVNIPSSEKMFPTEKRIKGEHIKEMADQNIPKTFQKVKQKIEGEF